MKDKKINLHIEPEKIVIITEDHGGYLAGRCIACDESGWLDNRLGYKYNTKNVPGNHLVHKKHCPVNDML